MPDWVIRVFMVTGVAGLTIYQYRTARSEGTWTALVLLLLAVGVLLDGLRSLRKRWRQTHPSS
jgi:hypothetical protein